MCRFICNSKHLLVNFMRVFLGVELEGKTIPIHWYFPTLRMNGSKISHQRMQNPRKVAYCGKMSTVHNFRHFGNSERVGKKIHVQVFNDMLLSLSKTHAIPCLCLMIKIAMTARSESPGRDFQVSLEVSWDCYVNRANTLRLYRSAWTWTQLSSVVAVVAFVSC